MPETIRDEYWVKISLGPDHGKPDPVHHSPSFIDYRFEVIDEVTDDLLYDGDGQIDDIPFHFYLAPDAQQSHAVMMWAARAQWLEAYCDWLFPPSESEKDADSDDF